MTKFIDKTKESLVKNEVKETKFLKSLEYDFSVADSNDSNPGEYNTVEFIGNDSAYGDVFKAYDSDPNEFTLFFGIKGDEFD